MSIEWIIVGGIWIAFFLGFVLGALFWRAVQRDIRSEKAWRNDP